MLHSCEVALDSEILKEFLQFLILNWVSLSVTINSGIQYLSRTFFLMNLWVLVAVILAKASTSILSTAPVITTTTKIVRKELGFSSVP